MGWAFSLGRSSSGGLGSSRFPSIEASSSPACEARWSRGRMRRRAVTGLASLLVSMTSRRSRRSHGRARLSARIGLDSRPSTSLLRGSRSHGRTRESAGIGLVMRLSTSVAEESLQGHGRACGGTRTGLESQLQARSVGAASGRGFARRSPCRSSVSRCSSPRRSRWRTAEPRAARAPQRAARARRPRRARRATRARPVVRAARPARRLLWRRPM